MEEERKKMLINLDQKVSFELYNLEDLYIVKKLAKKNNQLIYTFQTTGRFNWLEKGVHLVDGLGLVLISKNLPSRIELPNDIGD